MRSASSELKEPERGRRGQAASGDQRPVTASCGSFFQRGSALAGRGHQAGPDEAASGPGLLQRGMGFISGGMGGAGEAEHTARSPTRTQPGMHDQQSVTASCGSMLQRGSALAQGGQAGPGGAASGPGLLQRGMGLISGMGGGGAEHTRGRSPGTGQGQQRQSSRGR
jgi:hypothetical protein